MLIGLFWETGIRIGAVHSIDLQDIHIQEEYIELAHRPDQGTTLKNGKSGERPVAISPQLATILDEYIDNTRYPVEDEYGRHPLITSRNQRLARSSIRLAIYKTTAPCFRNEECPDCTGNADKKCPDAVHPHAIRRGSITHHLTQDVPVEVVSDRMNVSRKVRDQHYDQRTEEVKLEQRRGYLANL